MQVTQDTPFRKTTVHHDLRVRLLMLHLVLGVVVVLLVLFFGSFARQRLEQDIRQSDIALAQAIAMQVNPAEQRIGDTSQKIARWLSQVWGDQVAVVTVVDSSGQNIMQLKSRTRLLQDSEWSLWSSWQREVIRQALAQERGSYVTVAPDDESWLHSVVETPESGGRVIIQRPTRVAFATLTNLNRTLFVALALYLAGGIYFWARLSKQIISPLETMERFSGMVRERRQSVGREASDVHALSQRNDQVGNLSRALVAMEREIEARFVQQTILLETSQIVAGSLDTNDVTRNILEQIQRLFSAEAAAITSFNQRANLLEVHATVGLDEADRKRLRVAPTDQPSAPGFRAIRENRLIQQTPIVMDRYQSSLSIPLATRYAAPAVLIIYKQDAYRFSEDELRVAATFANHAAIALDNSELFSRTDEQLQAQKSQLEAIVESLDVGLVLESPVGDVLYCNQQAAHWAGVPRELAVGLPSVNLLEQLKESYAVTETDDGLELVSSAENSFHDLRIYPFNVNDANGDVIGRGQIWQDVTFYKDIDRMKSTLLSTVSHELRTPLTAIKGYATTLLAPDVDWEPAKQHKFLSTISTESDRLMLLIRNLLDMSRLEAGTLKMQSQPYPLNKLLPTALDMVGLNGDERIKLDLCPDLPPTLLDSTRVLTVMRNYLENAVKYSPPDAPIAVCTTRAGSEVIFSVRDFGTGVPAELQERLFEPFFRADNRLTRKIGGVGLGLAICKGLIEAQGGKVWAESEEPGMVFSFSLPLLQRAPEAPLLDSHNLSESESTVYGD